MDEQLRQATLGAVSAQAPTSPLGSFPEISKLYDSSFQSLQSAAPTSVRLNLAKDTVAAAKAKKDGSNFQKVKKGDGGFDFFDAEGKPISAYDYAIATGKRPSEVLGDSENPIDMGYLQDFENLKDFLTVYRNKDYSTADKEKVDEFVKDQPELKRYIQTNDIVGLMERFKQAYPTVYGGGNASVPVGRTFIPKYNRDDGVDYASGGGAIGS